MHEEAIIISRTRQWVEEFVIGLNLCPFARKELANDRIRFVVTRSSNEQGLLEVLESELEFLAQHPATETTLLIHPDVLQDFSDFNAFLDPADDLIAGLELEGTFQIASFHPAYQFAGTQAQDAENYTNRSPFPMLHILREDSLEKAIAGHPAVDQIPTRNIALMNEMGVDRLERLIDHTEK